MRPVWAQRSLRTIARSTLQEFVCPRAGHKHETTFEAALDAWFDEVREARDARWTRTPM